MNRSNRRPCYGVLCGAIVLALLGGCGKKEQNVSVPGGNVTVKQQAGGTTVEMTSNKGDKVKITAGDKGVALPANFPADVPIMPGATVKMAMTSGDALSVTFSVAASQADALKYYEDNLKAKGWEIAATMNMGESAVLSAKKGKRECVMNVGKDGSGSMVQLVAPLEKS